MGKPQLLYGAYDTGPSNYGLDVISYAQRKLNWGVKYIGNNATYADVYGMSFDYAIVGGPSSFENNLDAMILTVSPIKNKSVYVLGDSPGSVLRPGIKGFVDGVTAIVALPSDIAPAKNFGYKDAVWLGYPSHWGNLATTKPSDIFTRGECPIADVRVFVCGLKEAEITDNMLASVIHGMETLDSSWMIYFQAHPSEIATTQNLDRRAKLIAHPRVYELKTRENIASLMMVMYLTVCTGGSTAILDGAFLRLPVLYYLDAKVMDYMKKQVNDEIWRLVTAGACEITLPSLMSFELQRLLVAGSVSDGARKYLRWKQKAAFPTQPAEMNTVADVLAYIQNPAGYIPFAKR